MPVQGEVGLLHQEHNKRVEHLKAQHAAWAERQQQQSKEQLMLQQQQMQAQVERLPSPFGTCYHLCSFSSCCQSSTCLHV